MSTAGRMLLSSLVYSGDIQQYIKLALEPHLFKEGEIQLYEFIAAHLVKHGKIPSQSTVEEKLPDALVQAPEPPSYYSDEVEKRYLHNSLKAMVQQASAMLQTKHAEDALATIAKTIGDLQVKRNRTQIMDFRDAHEIVYQAYLQQKTMSNAVALPFGWATLDDQVGGMRAGDFVSIVGRPMAGKTFLMLYTAMMGWKNKRKGLVVSMEMAALIILQRLAAMHSKKKLKDLLKAELSSKAFTSLMQDLMDLKENDTPLMIVDGNLTATPEDVVMQARQFGASFVHVDATYLMQSTNPRMGKWEKQADNAQKLKQRVAQDLGIPVIASYQFSKQSEKDNKKTKGNAKPSGADVYGSDEIFQLSSVMLGLFDDEDDIESKNTRNVHVLKGRSGETGQFKIKWDFQNMDFSEHLPEKPEDLQMNHLG